MAMPNMKFHICALTEMSQKLMNYDQYENVRLYPGCKASEVLTLFDTCDYYLDINYENEICDAIKEAFLHNLLILGFKETLHTQKYILSSLVFDAKDYADMVQVIVDDSHLDLNLNRQRVNALSQSEMDYQAI